MCICRPFGKVTEDVVNIQREWQQRNQTLALDREVWFEFEVLTWPQMIIQSELWTNIKMLDTTAHLQGLSGIYSFMSRSCFGRKVEQRNIRQVVLSLYAGE